MEFDALRQCPKISTEIYSCWLGTDAKGGTLLLQYYRNIAMQSVRLKNKVYLNFTVVIPFSHRVDEYS